MVRNYKHELPQQLRSTLQLFVTNWNVMRIFYLKWNLILNGLIDKSQTVSSAAFVTLPSTPRVFDTVVTPTRVTLTKRGHVLCFSRPHRSIVLPSYSPTHHLNSHDSMSSWLVLKLGPAPMARSKLHYQKGLHKSLCE